jgi:hypothetical protein
VRCCSKVGNHGGVDRVGLGTLPKRLGKGADLGRIDDGDRKPGAADRCSGNGLKPARRFQRHNRGAKLLQSGNQLLQPCAITFHRERLATRINSNVETVLGYVDSNCDDVHGDPSLPNRASRFAAQATVRVRWTDGRGTSLIRGLQRPRGLRTPIRHRTVYNTRQADFRLTRGSIRELNCEFTGLRIPLTRIASQSDLSRKGRGAVPMPRRFAP